MNNSKMLFEELVARIATGDPKSEVVSIAEFILETMFSLTRTDIIAAKPVRLSDDDRRSLEVVIQRVNQGEPVQYALGVASFFGRQFSVSPSVLIPRPETEELIEYALQLPITGSGNGSTILDIGTGSGCIAVTLALEMPDARIIATDTSPAALEIARKNAARLRASVEFINHDILEEAIGYQNLDLAVSNPPYVASSERHLLKRNVVDYEPHLALFVADEDPLIFYRVIAAKAFPALRPGGYLLVEINERFGEVVASIFSEAGYQTDVVMDISGKDRIVCGRKPAN